ncbi:MAG: hypothetical protein ABR525_01200 [Candidatus Limnocylindria bacterium]
MDDRSAKVAALLHEAAETHHRVYRIVDGDDPDWASWYADWLLTLSELPQLIGTTPVRSELVYTLVRLDKEFARQAPGAAWEPFYAAELLRVFGEGAGARQT